MIPKNFVRRCSKSRPDVLFHPLQGSRCKAGNGGVTWARQILTMYRDIMSDYLDAEIVVRGRLGLDIGQGSS